MANKPTIEVVPADAWHCIALAKNLRQADRDELSAVSDVPHEQTILDAFERSQAVHTVTINGVPAAMFGVCAMSLLSGVGIPWLLATDAFVPVCRREFMKRSRGYLRQMQAGYEVLTNCVDCRNTASIRWLKWLGFKFFDPKPMGLHGLPFMRFELRSTEYV